MKVVFSLWSLFFSNKIPLTYTYILCIFWVQSKNQTITRTMYAKQGVQSYQIWLLLTNINFSTQKFSQPDFSNDIFHSMWQHFVMKFDFLNLRKHSWKTFVCSKSFFSLKPRSSCYLLVFPISIQPIVSFSWCDCKYLVTQFFSL